ncbi:reverse transcriptase domain-containing protein [Tanacetum coccineum]
MIGSTLTEEGRNKLCSLLKRNLDIFAWKHADMIGVPRHITKLRLNVREGCSSVRQNKRGQAADRNQAIQEEVGKLIEVGIMKEVHYHDWLSNPVMIRRNLKVYVDDLVIKSRTEDEIVRDIEEAFKTLREINMKLNPKKCTFGIEERMFLGYKVSTRGLKVCPDKVDVVLSLPSPKFLKDVQKLNEKLVSLNRFLAKSAEKSLPFFKTLKKCTKKSDFHWTTEAEEAFKQMKRLIAELSMLVAPMEKKELIMYLAAAKETILADFIVERLKEDSPDTLMAEEEELPEPWILFTDESSCTDGSVAGLILINPEGMEFTYALRFSIGSSRRRRRYVDDSYLQIPYGWNTTSKGEKARAVRRKSWRFAIINGILYKKSFLGPWLRCVGPLHANYVLREIHKGSCSMHVVHKPIPKNPQRKLSPITSPWPFYKWGIDIAGPFTSNQIKKFAWDNIVCRFGLPGEFISDNGK